MLNGKHQMSTSSFSLNNTFESQASRESSSYFVPNYPMREPVFYVPRVPQLVKVPEPTAPTRPPPPGYDMKTLRKQLEYLNNEISTKTETQSLLYTQNEQLWLFIQELQDANKTNAQLMREEIKRYQDELLNAQNERRRVADQLITARNSKKMLEDLNRDLEASLLTEQDVDRLKYEAEKELARSKAENALLEQTLQERVSQMTSVHQQLDELRHEAREERDLERAEDFYLTNKSILKSAYSRFKTGITKRLKEGRIHHTLYRIYTQYLKLMTVKLWRAYLHRRRVMHRNDAKRRRETRHDVFSKWKVYTALERLFRQTRRTYLLRHFLGEWQRSTALARQEHETEALTDRFQERQYVKRHFLAWKRTIVFLNWNGKQTVALEGIASLYFLRKIVSQWKLVTDVANNALYQKTCVIPNLIDKNRLALWHAQCVSVWKARGRLMRRFFSHLRDRIVDRRETAKTTHFGSCAHIRYQKLTYLRKWILRLQSKRKYSKLLHQYTAVSTSGHALHSTPVGLNSSRKFTNYELLNHDDHAQRLRNLSASTPQSKTPTPRNAVSTPMSSMSGLKLTINTSSLGGGGQGPTTSGSVSSYSRLRSLHTPYTPHHYNTVQIHRLHKYKMLRGALFSILYSSTILRRQRVVNQIAMTRYLSNMAANAVRVWRKHVRADVRRRRKSHLTLYRTTFDDWIAFIKRQRAEIIYRDKVFAFTDRVQRDRHSSLLGRWRELVKYNKRLHVCHTYLSKRVYFRRLRQVFTHMRNRYSNALYWRHKQVEVDFSHVTSLQALALLEISDLQREHERTLSANEQLEKRIRDMEELLAQRDADLKAKQKSIAAKEIQRDELVEVLQQTQSALSDTQAERERLRGYEQVLQANLDKQHHERTQRQMEVNVMLSNIQTESEALRLEVQTAREQAVYAEQMASIASQREGLECARTVQRAEEMEREVERRQREVAELERDHQSMLRDLSRVQSKLLDMTRSGEEMKGEYAADIRSKQSEVNVLRSNIGLAEARIAALQSILSDGQEDRSLSHRRDVQLSEQQELEELEVIRQQLEEEQRQHSRQYYRGGQDTSSNSISHYRQQQQQPLRLSTLSSASPDHNRHLTEYDLSLSDLQTAETFHADALTHSYISDAGATSHHSLLSQLPRPPHSTILSSGRNGRADLYALSTSSANNLSEADSDLEGVSREDIFRLTSPSKRSPKPLSVSSGQSGSHKVSAVKKVSPFARPASKKTPFDLSGSSRHSSSASSNSDPPSPPHPAPSDYSTSIFDLAAIGSMSNPYLSAASIAREAIEATHLRLSARGFDEYQAEEGDRAEMRGGDTASQNSSVYVEMDGSSATDRMSTAETRSVASSSVSQIVTAGRASYLDAKRSAAQQVEGSSREAQYQETRSAIRQLTERLRDGDGEDTMQM